MGYDLHVTRADSWTESAASPIKKSEWRKYVDADPELTSAGAVEATPPEGVLRNEDVGFAVWHGHPTGEAIVFDLREGEIVVKNPDGLTIAKMISIANDLHAHVEGDEGEIYDASHPTGQSVGLTWQARFISWIRNRIPLSYPVPPERMFHSGHRVKDVWGNEGVVVAVDLEAEHRLGRVRVHFDDGRELEFTAVAHGLTLM